jgi:hypothetical protein
MRLQGIQKIKGFERRGLCVAPFSFVTFLWARQAAVSGQASKRKEKIEGIASNFSRTIKISYPERKSVFCTFN